MSMTITGKNIVIMKNTQMYDNSFKIVRLIKYFIHTF